MFHGVVKRKHLMSNRVGVSTMGRATFHNNLFIMERIEEIESIPIWKDPFLTLKSRKTQIRSFIPFIAQCEIPMY